MKILIQCCCLLVLFSCKKNCVVVDLPQKECGKNYQAVNGVYTESRSDNIYEFNTPFIVNTDSEYVANFTDASGNLILGAVDFTKSSIIGCNLKTDPCTDFKSQGYLCKSNDSENWTFQIDYSLKDQCDGNGITTYKFCAFFICDKIPDNSAIEANIINVNPIE